MSNWGIFADTSSGELLRRGYEIDIVTGESLEPVDEAVMTEIRESLASIAFLIAASSAATVIAHVEAARNRALERVLVAARQQTGLSFNLTSPD